MLHGQQNVKISRHVSERFQNITTNGGWLPGRYGADGDVPLARPQYHQAVLWEGAGECLECQFPLGNRDGNDSYTTPGIAEGKLSTNLKCREGRGERERGREREREILLYWSSVSSLHQVSVRNSELQKQSNTASGASIRRNNEKKGEKNENARR